MAILALAAKSSIAQTKFSFSGLDWGDSVAQADVKLSVAGFQIPMMDKLGCKMKKSCTVQFSGPVSGSASFEENRLTEVFVASSPNSFSDRAAKLRARYGQPLQSQQPADNSSFMALTEELLTLRWADPSGESLTLTRYGSILYRSSAANRARNLPNEVKF